MGIKQKKQTSIRRSARRECLQELLKQKERKSSTVVHYRPEFPWGVITIDAQNCSACGLCHLICPTGAISKKLEKGYQSYFFNGSLCTNCSLCTEACPRKAIDFEKDFTLADILEDEVNVVAKIKMGSCTICGEVIAAEKKELCSTCQNRQLTANVCQCVR